MPLLLIAIIAASYWGYTRGKSDLPFFPAFPPFGGTGVPPGAQVAPIPPVPAGTPILPVPVGTPILPVPAMSQAAGPNPLTKEIMDLLRNGQNPVAMHAAANELEKYGFFDAALLLHKRAEELSLAQPNSNVLVTTAEQILLQNQLRDAEMREQALRDQLMREQIAREQTSREQAAREQTERDARDARFLGVIDERLR